MVRKQNPQVDNGTDSDVSDYVLPSPNPTRKRVRKPAAAKTSKRRRMQEAQLSAPRNGVDSDRENEVSESADSDCVVTLSTSKVAKPKKVAPTHKKKIINEVKCSKSKNKGNQIKSQKPVKKNVKLQGIPKKLEVDVVAELAVRYMFERHPFAHLTGLDAAKSIFLALSLLYINLAEIDKECKTKRKK